LGVIQNEAVHPKLESQPSPDENPESQQALGFWRDNRSNYSKSDQRFSRRSY
jgi:hypothetical protein